MSCLLLIAAVLVWPQRSRGMSTGARPRKVRSQLAWPGRGGHQDAMGRRGAEATGAGTIPGGWRVIAGATLVGAGGLAFVVAGVAGLIASVAVLVTGTALVRRALADRRDRVAMVEILAGLRMLGRELRAGAEPAVAAGNAGAAARGAGAEVLHGLVRLTRADDRSAGGPGSFAGHGPTTAGSAADRASDRGKVAGTEVGLAEDPGSQVAARLRSGWLLTRRHGLAFTPLIDALTADLSEQIAAAAERAGQVAGPRMSGYVMAVLPVLGLVLGMGMGADPFRILLLTPVGNILLLVGVLLTCAGLLWSARIVGR